MKKVEDEIDKKEEKRSGEIRQELDDGDDEDEEDKYIHTQYNGQSQP